MIRIGKKKMSTLWVGKLSRDTDERDVEDAFYKYGRINKCEGYYFISINLIWKDLILVHPVKNGFAFVSFDDSKDAEDAYQEMHGANIRGSRIIVEWAKGKKRTGDYSFIFWLEMWLTKF